MRKFRVIETHGGHFLVQEYDYDEESWDLYYDDKREDYCYFGSEKEARECLEKLLEKVMTQTERRLDSMTVKRIVVQYELV
jgi:hypothetical protein